MGVDEGDGIVFIAVMPDDRRVTSQACARVIVLPFFEILP